MWRDPLRGGGGRLTPQVRWRLATAPDPVAVTALAGALGVPAPLAALLVQRGHVTPEAATTFLRPDLNSLSDPHRLAGMADAVTTIVATVERGGRIMVHGDYDVDGQCSAAILVRALRAAGADVHGFTPHRIRDGYDFGAAGVAEAKRIGADLVLTCDCGITAIEAVAAARSAGLAVVVTDHHLPGSALPAANAVIDPQRADDASGLGMLAGSGVAFKLVQALVQPLGLPDNLPWHLLDLVALATIADVVPLVGENRVLVRHGMKLLQSSRWPGVRALIDVARLSGKGLRAGQVGFTLAPRLNAVGRVGDAMDGLKLLLSDDPAEAGRLAQHCDRLNGDRQALDQAILAEVLERIERDHLDPELNRSLVLAGEGWHPGVIGIVASRVVERYGRPTFMIAIDDGGMGKGSGRSIAALELPEVLAECADLLERHGGHHMAAGLTIRADRVAAFRERFEESVRKRLPVGATGPVQRVDLEIDPAALDDDLERLGRHLEPCGMGNPAPVFGIRKVRLERPQIVGTNHLKASLAAGQRSIDLIAFGWADRAAPFRNGPIDLAVRLDRNEWQGRSSLQVRALAMTPG